MKKKSSAWPTRSAQGNCKMKPLLSIKNLPYLAALFQAFQFAHAGSVYFGAFGWVIGGAGGMLTNLAVAIAASRISMATRSRSGRPTPQKSAPHELAMTIVLVRRIQMVLFH